MTAIFSDCSRSAFSLTELPEDNTDDSVAWRQKMSQQRQLAIKRHRALNKNTFGAGVTVNHDALSESGSLLRKTGGGWEGLLQSELHGPSKNRARGFEKIPFNDPSVLVSVIVPPSEEDSCQLASSSVEATSSDDRAFAQPDVAQGSVCLEPSPVKIRKHAADNKLLQAQALHVQTGWGSHAEAKERGQVREQSSWRPWDSLKRASSNTSTKIVEIPSHCGTGEVFTPRTAELKIAGAFTSGNIRRHSETKQHTFDRSVAGSVPGCLDWEDESTDDGSSLTPEITDSDQDPDDLDGDHLCDDENKQCLGGSDCSHYESPDTKHGMTSGEVHRALNPKAKAQMGRLTRLVNRFVPKLHARKVVTRSSSHAGNLVHGTPVTGLAREVD